MITQYLQILEYLRQGPLCPHFIPFIEVKHFGGKSHIFLVEEFPFSARGTTDTMALFFPWRLDRVPNPSPATLRIRRDNSKSFPKSFG